MNSWICWRCESQNDWDAEHCVACGTEALVPRAELKKLQDRIRELCIERDELKAQLADNKNVSLDQFSEGDVPGRSLSADEWNTLKQHFPLLEEIRNRLLKFSPELGRNFSCYLAYKKDHSSRFDSQLRDEIDFAISIENEYMSANFGTGQKLLDCARVLILNSKKEQVAELKGIVKMLGKSLKYSEDDIVANIKSKNNYLIFYSADFSRYPR